MALSSKKLRVLRSRSEGFRTADMYTAQSDLTISGVAPDAVLSVYDGDGVHNYAALDSPAFTRARSKKFFSDGSALNVVVMPQRLTNGNFESAAPSFTVSTVGARFSMTREVHPTVGAYWGTYYGLIKKTSAGAVGDYIDIGFSLSSNESAYVNTKAAVEFDFIGKAGYKSGLIVARVLTVGGKQVGSDFSIPNSVGRGRIDWIPSSAGTGVTQYVLRFIVVGDDDTGAVDDIDRYLLIDNLSAGVPLVHKVARKIQVTSEDSSDSLDMRVHLSKDEVSTDTIPATTQRTVVEEQVDFDISAVGHKHTLSFSRGSWFVPAGYNCYIAVSIYWGSPFSWAQIYVDDVQVASGALNPGIISWQANYSGKHTIRIVVYNSYIWPSEFYIARAFIEQTENAL